MYEVFESKLIWCYISSAAGIHESNFILFFYTLCSLILLCGPYPCVWLYSGKYLNARSHTHLLNEHCRKTADRNKWTAHNLNSPFSFFFEVKTFKSHAKHLLLEISSEIYFVSVIPFLFCLHRHTQLNQLFNFSMIPKGAVFSSLIMSIIQAIIFFQRKMLKYDLESAKSDPAVQTQISSRSRQTPHTNTSYET